MRLLLTSVDMRGGYREQVAWENEIVDEETGKRVGVLYEETKPRSRQVSLFGGKYQYWFKSREECIAFAKGVEAVLNHITSIENEEPATPEPA